jgi:outer membrane protein assembly factor BamD (BamD/ComL family)
MVMPPSPPEGTKMIQRSARSHAAASRSVRDPRLLDEEVVLLERAQEALAHEDGSTALAIVSRYETRFPKGVLAEEAEVVRIEALALAKESDRAAERAQRFLDAHPHSPHADRARSILERIRVNAPENQEP